MSRDTVKVAEVLQGKHREIRVKHFLGLPPEISLDRREASTELPLAERLVIVQVSDGFLLYRFTRTGACGGDTWHTSLDEVYNQAQSEFGVEPADWIDIPVEIENWFEHVFPQSM
jgi:hypothetical protein